MYGDGSNGEPVVKKKPAPQPMAPKAANPYASPIKLDRSGVSQEFDAQRAKASQIEQANLQGQKDALARRAAQLGGGPSGALIKQEALAQDAMGRRLGDANMMINSAQSAEMRRIGEMEQGLNFQREERLANQAMQEEQFNKTFGLSQAQFDLAKQQYGDQKNQWQKTFDFTKGQTDFENKETARNSALAVISNLLTSGRSPEQVGQIMQSFNLDFESLGIDPSILGIKGFTAASDPIQRPQPSQAASSNSATGVRWQREPGTGRMYYIDANGRKQYG